MQCVVVPESGFTAFWTLSISWSGQSSCTNSLNIFIDILCDWISKSSQDKDILCYWILNGSQDTDICVSGHRMDHRADHRTGCRIQWTNLTVSYSGQVRLVSLLYHCMCY